MLFDTWVEQMKTKFAAMNRPMLDSNLKQAELPKSAEIIDNPVGTACGFKIVLNDCVLVFTPGVPREFKSMITAQVMSLMKSLSGAGSFEIKRYLCFGIGESTLAEQLDKLAVPDGVEFGYRAAMPFVEVKLFNATGQSVNQLLTQVERIIAPFMVVKDGNSLSLLVHQLLVDKAQATMEQTGKTYKFGTVESCTGGMVANQLVDYSGSSEYFNRSLVTYSNEAKQQLADVNQQTLINYGAVSTQTAEQMAQGAVNKWHLDLAVAITGVAGPGGGSDEKPVGTVGFALATKQGVVSQLLYLPNRGRTAVRVTATAIALDMVRRHLQDIEVVGEYQSFKRQLG